VTGGVCAVVAAAPLRREEVLDLAAAAPHRGAARVLSRGHASLAALGDATASRTGSDGVITVVDGRLDNAPELCGALVRRGLLPARTSDAAALVAAAYRAWGPDFPSRLLGDFALVVWDEHARRLVLARDPLGMRNLFVRPDPDGSALVATEVRQIATVLPTTPHLNEAAVLADMRADFGQEGWSFYEGVEQVAPGTVLELVQGRRRQHRFWEVDGARRLRVGHDEAAALLRDTFTDAVGARLGDDRPVGVLLSGGMDSSSVASVAGRLVESGAVTTPSLHAFCWAFEELVECDERHVSRHVVDRYGLRLTEVPADRAGPLACYPDHLPHFDDPLLGAFQPLIEHSVEAARDAGVRVLLGGDRGDLLVGPTGFSPLRLLREGRAREVHRLVTEQRSATGESAVEALGRQVVAVAVQRLRRLSLERVAGGLRGDAGGAAAEAPGVPWIRADWARRVGPDADGSGRTPPEGLDAARLARYRQVFTPLHMRGMTWSERTYARHGVTFADPFSDARLVALVLALPQTLLARHGTVTKPLLRAAMVGTIPDEALRTAGKTLPSPLYRSGLRTAAPLLSELLRTPLVEERGWVDASVLREHLDGWVRGGDLRSEFWWTLQVELWLRAHHGR
jgi:asparagine synthase (glutamine-hydrolysing)